MGSRGPPDVSKLHSLRVDNLSYDTTKEDLESDFKEFGEIGDVYLPRDKETRKSRGFAFIRFYDEKDAEEALAKMDGVRLDGREIRVSVPPPRRDDDSGGYRGGGGGGGGGYRGGGGGRDDRRDDRRRSPPRRRSYSRSRSRSPRRR